ncbi:uncharacterized protein LOC120684824 [Panicum virgatum]|uniref:uncharacterized protein LOC120684824 n=1 Tax=Panicum virgatum TaxID=38727 RepID=UPI0019D607C4|nr:uncharacterized protein LOC120684824 [Panicum virgatum]
MQQTQQKWTRPLDDKSKNIRRSRPAAGPPFHGSAALHPRHTGFGAAVCSSAVEVASAAPQVWGRTGGRRLVFDPAPVAPAHGSATVRPHPSPSRACGDPSLSNPSAAQGGYGEATRLAGRPVRTCHPSTGHGLRCLWAMISSLPQLLDVRSPEANHAGRRRPPFLFRHATKIQMRPRIFVYAEPFFGCKGTSYV